MVGKLITSKANGLEELLLASEKTTIGRKPNNDIHIDHLSVSGNHAQIITIMEDSFIEDLGSTNGTFVNGKPIKKHALNDGDNIILGKYPLSYHKDAANYDSDQTMVIQTGQAGMPTQLGNKELDQSVQKISVAIASEAASAKPTSFTNKEACLQLLSGTNAGKELVLTKALTTIGQPGVQVAAITRRPHGFFLISVDGGPNNSTPKVSGASIGSNSYELQDHNIIEVAGVKMEFYLR